MIVKEEEGTFALHSRFVRTGLETWKPWSAGVPRSTTRQLLPALACWLRNGATSTSEDNAERLQGLTVSGEIVLSASVGAEPVQGQPVQGNIVEGQLLQPPPLQPQPMPGRLTAPICVGEATRFQTIRGRQERTRQQHNSSVCVVL